MLQEKEDLKHLEDITIEEIDAIKIIQKPILIFKDKEPVEEILQGDALDKWLEEV